MKTLFVSDLDGTLLNSHSEISSYSLETINQLIEQGMHFTYATARSLNSSAKITAGLQKNIPVIIYNGAMIVNAMNGTILYQCSFTKDERKYLHTIFKESQINPIVYTFLDNKEKVLWFQHNIHNGAMKYIQSRQGDSRFQSVTHVDQLYQGKIFYYTCIADQDTLFPIYQQLKDDERFTCTFQQELYSDEYWLEIMPKKATKAQAIQKLKELWECDNIVAFGDAINDIPMFQIADTSYAVDNAVPALKAIATNVILSNDEDGVAVCLKKEWKERNEERLL